MGKTQSLEKEILAINKEYWDGYLTGDWEKSAAFVADNMQMTGSTEDEIFHGKEEVIQFFKDSKEQVAGKLQLRNSKINIRTEDSLVLTDEYHDIYFKDEKDWSFYERIRISSVLKSINGEWKYIQQHGSVPDSKVQEGETFALGKISEENLQLKDAVKRRTVELEAKTRELEIDTALERIRKQSLRMKHSDELDETSRIFHEQLLELNIPSEISYVWLPDVENKKHQFWAAWTETKAKSIKILSRSVTYDLDLDEPHTKKCFEVWQSDENYHSVYIPQNELKDFFKSWKEILGGAKNLTTKNFPDGIYYAEAYMKYGCFGINIGRKLTTSEADILRRFSIEFERTYTRFLDLKKAEAHAREAQIEAALERVRSRSMAMHHTSELQDVINTLHTQLLGLDLPITGGAFIAINEEIKDEIKCWGAGGTTDYVERVDIPFLDIPIYTGLLKGINKGPGFFTESFSHKQKIEFFEHLLKKPPYLDVSPEKKKEIMSREGGYTRSCAVNKNTSIFIINHHGVEFSEDENTILKRFAAVFEQTYTRFLDLQRAESQAREAQIQLSLERVRAKAMAMRESEELTEVLPIIFEQLDGLGVKTVWTHLTLIDLEKNTFTYRMTGREGKRVFAEQVVDLDASEIWKDSVKSFKSQQPESIVRLFFPPESLPDIWNIFDGIFSSLPEGHEIYIEDFPGGIYTTEANCEFGYIGLNKTEKATEEEESILLRFAKEFGRLYRRFLDLQRAEAQARESQIQLSLERVRAKAMAMRESEELTEVLPVIFEQLDGLGVKTVWTHLTLIDLEKNTFTYRMTGREGKRVFAEQVVDIDASDIWKDAAETFKSDEPDSITRIYFPPEYLPELWEIFDEIFPTLSEGYEIHIQDFPGGLYTTQANCEFGYVGINSTEKATEEEENILLRFAKEFGRLYRRFLDLQKAEAQARESQIQLSLERVRAKSMSMQSSDELHEILSVLFQQFDVLDIKPVNVFLSLFDKKERTLTYRASGKGGERKPSKQVIDIDSLDSWTELFNKWEKDSSDEVEVIFYPPEIFPELFELLDETFSKMPKKHRITPADVPNGGYSVLGYTKFGYLGFDHTRPPTEEEKEILSRFCIEFARAFQRFLDIKKAEKQAKEAQIEAALERIRSESLAMQNSQDLLDVVVTIRKEFIDLGYEAHYFWQMRWLEDKYEKAMTSGDGSRIGMVMELPRDFHTKYEDTAKWEKSNEPIHVLAMDAKTAVDYVDRMVSQGNFQQLDPNAPSADDIRAIGGLTFVMARTSHGEIGYSLPGVVENPPEEDVKILQRFAKVFDLAHQRFEDLQIKERQFRETQIQLALEKVRSKAMAMRSSEDISEATTILFQEIKSLGINFLRCGIGIMKKNQAMETWATSHSEEKGRKRIIGEIDMTIHPVLKAVYKDWKDGKSFSRYNLEGQSAIDYYNAINKKTNYKFPPGHMVEERHYANLFCFKEGALFVFTKEIFDESSISVLERFTRVIALTYRRYLDIVTAENRAREAQIEAALERVRSRSMAMHESDDLLNVVTVLFEQLKISGIDLKSGAVSINIYIPDSKDLKGYVCGEADDGLVIQNFNFPYFKNAIRHDFYKAREEQPNIFIGNYDKQNKDEFYKILFEQTELQQISALGKTEILETESLTLTIVPSDHFMISIIDLQNRKLTEEEIGIVRKFVNVFKQSYTRFLDLKKAEAQAREAQIEAALERVRAQSMAMHKSQELHEVIKVVGEQLLALNLEFDSCNFLQVQDDGSWDAWILTPAQPYPKKIHIPFIDHVSITSVNKVIEEGAEFHRDILSKRDKNIFFNHFFTNTLASEIPQERKDYVLDRPAWVRSIFIMKNINLVVTNYLGVPFSDTANEIFMRFKKVFEQAYTRFLDLQKAEAQAREAQIEAALERVRSRSMAMQHSNELQETALELFQQLENLGAPLFGCGFNIWNEDDETATAWMAGKERIQPPFKTSNNEDVFLEIRNAYEQGEKLFIKEQSGEELEVHYQYMASIPEFRTIVEKMNAVGVQLPKFQIVHCAFFSHGYLMFISHENVSAFHEIFIRFSNVFEQTYTRFLDLKKAEAQAREAQIEAALERVRSRTMGMQKSEELSEVAKVLFQQFSTLGKLPDRMSIGIIDEEVKEIKWWLTDQRGIGLEHSFTSPFKDNPTIDSFYKAWKKGKKSITIDLKGKELKTWVEFVTKKVKLHIDDSHIKGRRLHQGAFFSKGLLLISTHEPIDSEIFQILIRFAKVFDQTYTRFLDLKKAEEQAREAQIEAALERVRSRTMGMLKSEELLEVIETISQQLVLLDLNFDTVSFGRNSQESNFKFWLTSSGQPQPLLIDIPYLENPVLKSVIEAKKQKLDFQADHFDEKTTQAWSAHIIKYSELKSFPEKVKDYILNSPGFVRSSFFLQDIDLYVGNYRATPYTNEENSIFKRFAQVFAQAYTRFQDLQRAEDQAREAQIEAGLERLRAASMAMHNSEQLHDVVSVLYRELHPLIEDFDIVNIMLNLEPKGLHFYNGLGEKVYDELYHIPDQNLKLIKEINKAWKSKDGLIEIPHTKEEKDKFFKVAYNHQPVPPDRQKMINKAEGMVVMGSFNNNTGIDLIRYRTDLFSEETKNIIIRFSKVFEQTYTRFLDLQKAEAQAREAQIEASLERIRAKSMAMHQSHELLDVINEIFKQLDVLNVSLDSCYINIYQKDNAKGFNMYVAAGGQVYGNFVNLPFKKNSPVFINHQKALKEGQDFYSLSLNKQQSFDFWNYFIVNAKNIEVSDERKKYLLNSEGLNASVMVGKYASVHLLRYNTKAFSEEDNKILVRIGNAFEQSYTRFLDLKKAEAQAREAQIEAALERLRSQSMAMHKSAELVGVARLLDKEIRGLGIEIGTSQILTDWDETDYSWNIWAATDGQDYLERFYLPYIEHPIGHRLIDAWKSGLDFYSESHTKAEKNNFLRLIFKDSDFRRISKERQEWLLNSPAMVRAVVIFKKATLIFQRYNSQEFTNEEQEIFKRFGKVFYQAYTRFLDLQKAEAQARESQIEAALERVRSKAMAMRSSEDLGEATTILFEEIEKLDMETMRCGIAILHENKTMDAWTTTMTEGKNVAQVSGNIDMTIHPSLERVFEAWKTGESFVQYKLEGKDSQKYYHGIAKQRNYDLPNSDVWKQTHYLNCCLFKDGGLYVFTQHKFNQQDLQVIERFTKVFALTYQRYKELIDSEIREREAKKQASLDRVRGEIASMRSTQDLNRITPIIWSELTNLGVPFFRCGVFIMNQEKKNIDVFLSDPEGKSLGLMNLDFDTNNITESSVKSWRKGQIYKAHWNKEEFIAWTQSLADLGKIETSEKYQGGEDAPDSLHLHFVPFSQGMLYVGNLEELNDENLSLVRNIAESFSIAYARYEDFKKLEKAKESIETALTELQQTQKQLIQSEKMASLGELTAGIAHEIQNPLNFVNNFSEVSGELLEEIEEELANGDIEEVKAILEDIKENLLKINHHGRRADSIVKGMLQHSRSSSGEKESVDINQLAEEYFNLAYHGLRAKDKSFNSKMKTELDPSIGKVKVVPQEIGRVLLNIINNAFYAVTEKKQTDSNGYEPTVELMTSHHNGQITITVKDNGSGMPKQVVDKIFQPFFTTKPTGQGTGLGLSMSYDIIKAHGGDLIVNTEEGIGTEFRIKIPQATN